MATTETAQPLPSAMQALVLTHLPESNTFTAVTKSVSLPELSPTSLLIRTHAVALNPIDPLYTLHPLGEPGRIIGSDFAGTVVKRGSGVPSNAATAQLGARVAGFVQGACSSNERPGAFAEYVVTEWDLVWSVSESEGMENAAAVSLCGLTAAQGLYYRLGLESPFPWGDNTSAENPTSGPAGDSDDVKTVFIYGASTSVGLYAAQLTQLSPTKVRLIGAASKARHAMLLAPPYNYSALVDYRDADWPEQVRAWTGEREGVDYAIDCISEGDSVVRASSCVRAKEGKMAIFRSRKAGAWKDGEMGVEPIYGAVWEGLGVEIGYSG